MHRGTNYKIPLDFIRRDYGIISIMDIKTQIKLQRKILNSITKHDTGCWIWNKKTRHKGYAQIMYKLGGKTKYTSPHRLAYIVFRNRFDLIENRTQMVCHKCDRKDCVNPSHMFIGDWLDNAMDDVLRNPNVSREYMDKITKMYKERYGIRTQDMIFKIFSEK